MTKKLARIKHYFFPQTSNNQQARFIHPSFLSLIVGAFLTTQFLLNYFNLYFPRVLGYASNVSPDQLLVLTNEERTKRGLPPLVNNQLLNEAAQMKAGDMFAVDYWAHNSPTGRTPWSFFKAVNYQYAFAGENLARDFNDSNGVVAAWMESPTHRDNILNDSYQEIGFAVVNGTLQGVETTLVVQLFGTPAGETAAAVAANSRPLFLSKPALASGESTSSAWFSDLAAGAQIQQGAVAQPIINPFSFTKLMVIFLTGLIVGVLVLDIYMVKRKKLIRLTGRSLAHLTFLLFIILIILITEQGLVL